MHSIIRPGVRAVVLLALLVPVPLRAQETPDARDASFGRVTPLPVSAPAAEMPLARAGVRLEEGAAYRPGAMMPLYAAYASLQVLDVHSTAAALGAGHAEANPVMRGVAGRPAAQLAVKAAGTAAVVYVSEKLWKKSRPGAVIVMIAANAAMAAVVQHNYGLARRGAPGHLVTGR